MKNTFTISGMDAGKVLVRRQNLMLLLKDYVRQERVFAEKIGIEPSYLSRIKGTLPISDGTARKIEAAFNKPAGWMDISTAARSAEAPYAVEPPPSPTLTEEERILLENFRALCPDQRETLKSVSDALAQSTPRKKAG